MNIIGLITTKNRLELFERALQSAFNQTRKPDRLIVVSDSLPQYKQEEHQLAIKFGAEFVEDIYTHNYAGSLNSAIHYILKTDISKNSYFEDTYLAMLDDDDLWLDSYLEECENTLNGEDFVVSGLVYCNEDGKKNLSIPANLTIDSFLKGNPHIQGSNTFVKLSTLLKAGLFDENMSSTTDRDVFTRIMLLQPTYAVCNKYLVEVDAHNSRERITNGKTKKADGLRKFYYKYKGYMLESVKQAFFERAQNLFGICKDEIEYIPSFNKEITRCFSPEGYRGNLTVGFIVTEYKLGLRLLQQLIALNRKNTKIVIYINFLEDRTPYIDLLENSGYAYEVIDRQRVLSRIKKETFDPFITADKLQGDIVKDIAVTRTILQKYLYELTTDEDVIWILDEDMELKELVANGEKITEVSLNIDKVIATYQSTYDAVVGSYALDAPLPTLSTLRTSLLDFVYNQTAEIGKQSTLSEYTDYYYDLSDCSNVHLETPMRIENTCTIDDVFSGKSQGRPLFVFSSEIKDVTSRGGNTLIFNRRLLEIPNWSILVGNKIGRRSDYFWAWQAKQQGYKIANVPFATLHNRRKQSFNMQKEEEKFLLDLIGSSFTKAIEVVGINARKQEFFKAYQEYFTNRLVKYVTSFYRINGLLSIINDNKYIDLFANQHLQAFVHNAVSYMQEDAVSLAFASLQRKLFVQTKMLEKDLIQSRIEHKFSLSPNSLRLLGCGAESIVFTDELYVYKYFFNPLENVDFLKKIGNSFNACGQLYALDFFEIDDATTIRYPYEQSAPYESGHAREFAELLRFTKENGFVFDNYKKDNFVVANGRLKLIDYGKSFLPYSEELQQKSIKRVFEMLRYPFLDENGFQQIIKRSYQNDTTFIDDGYELLEAVVNHRYKEDLHDDIVLNLVDEYIPQNVLDYGAGKCKIANALSQRYDVAVFDIDMETVQKRALPQVEIFDNAESIPSEKYDIVLNNLVLCCVENKTAEQIVRNIVDKVKNGGHVLISICNPFFNNVHNTELRTSGLLGKYNQTETFIKQTTIGTPTRKEYHRPIEFYLNLFERYGLRIEHIVEGRGANLDTLFPIAEHLIFVCKKAHIPRVYKDCSLMIKTNPMEHKSIYRNIRHIVTTLEKGGRFETRVAVVDLTTTENRARRYDNDDACILKRELECAKANGLLDKIIYADNNLEEEANIYNKYFGIKIHNGHAANGQGLYATLLGFESIDTKYVFQTDSDILYCNKDSAAFLKGLDSLRRGVVTATIGIATGKSGKEIYGKRTEVRTSFINLQKLQKRLPLPNTILEGMAELPWHRALDKVLQPKESVRLKNKDVWFVHPENTQKQGINFISYVEDCVAAGKAIPAQYGQVNLQEDKQAWAEQTDASVVVYIRGYNTPCEKLKRMFDSLKKQTYQNFQIVYVDDASTNESAEYAKFLLAYDKYFSGKNIAFFNDTNVGELANFVFVMQNVIKNKDAIVINLDNDDYLVNDRAIEIIIKKFDEGAEITCGNCFRFDKPLKKYKVESFEKVWERGGDNIWLHPKCFRRYLFDSIDIEKDLKMDDKFVDVNTDFAFMLPMIRVAQQKVFIEEVLYYFEPSLENVKRQGKYSDHYKAAVQEKLLQKEKNYAQRTKDDCKILNKCFV